MGVSFSWAWVKHTNQKNHRDHVFYRWMNEIPVLFLFGIVILAVVKPF